MHTTRGRDRHRRRAWGLAVAISSLGTACSTTTASPASTTVTAAPSTVTGAELDGASELTGRPYLVVDGIELSMDAYVPSDPGPWPLVVVFHGNSPAGKDSESNVVVAVEAARRGSLVVAPTWIAGDPFPLGVNDIVDLRHAASCATSFAQEWADELGGDPDDTVVYGFSAGAGPALAATVAPLGDVPDCATSAPPRPVAGAVLGDGEYFYQSEPFDGAFAEDLGAMREEVAAMTDPGRWPDDLAAQIFTWAAADGTAPRAVADPGDPAGWLARRDPNGSIRSDLDELGAFDDGTIDYVDAARFIDRRLAGSGLVTDLVVFPGGHTVADKVDELVSAIEAIGG